jgi:hypothetical protein
LPQCGITRVDVESEFPFLSLSPWIETAVQVLSRFSLQNFSKLLLKNLPQCVVKFNHETFLGCFLTFPVFSVLTTCFWSLAHLIGLSNALDHSVRRHFLNLRSAWSSLRFFHHILDSGSPLLISGLSSNFSVREKLPQCGTIKSMARPMDRSKVFFTFSPIRVSSRIAIQNPLFPSFDTITDLGDSAGGVHSPG